MKVEWSKPTLKELKGLERRVVDAIIQAVEAFAASGQGDVKRLTDRRPPQWRLRVGDYRVTFRVEEFGSGERSMTVLKVGHRRDVYRDR